MTVDYCFHLTIATDVLVSVTTVMYIVGWLVVQPKIVQPQITPTSNPVSKETEMETKA